MALAREEKERIVQEVKEVSASASSLVISDARGLKVSELTEIRKQGTESGVHIQVIKNSLAKLAFEGTDFGCTDEVLTGPSLFAFSYAEPGAAAKMLKTYAKNFEALEIKALVVEGQLLDGSQIDVLASLPSREEALTLIAAVLQAPIGKFATLLNEVPSKLARALANLLGTSLRSVANLPIGACSTAAIRVNASSRDGKDARTSICEPSRSCPSTTKALISRASKFFA